jgi:hypothetical protein
MGLAGGRGRSPTNNCSVEGHQSARKAAPRAAARVTRKVGSGNRARRVLVNRQPLLDGLPSPIWHRCAQFRPASPWRIAGDPARRSHRACRRKEGNRHLEVRVGNVETSDGGRQVFGAVARSDTDIAVQIHRSLEAVGRTAATKVTAFTDGCPGLRSILADAGVTTRPIADWFHIAMRLQHAKLAASGLLTDEPARKKAKVTIVAEVERLHWRIWNGKAKNAQTTFDRIRKVMHLYKGERGHRTRGVAS